MGVIKKQGISNSIVSYFGILLGLVSILIIQPRLLTSTEIGLLRALYSFAALVAMFIPLGIGSITYRYFPYFKNEENRHHGHFGFYILFTAVGLVIVSSLLLIFKEFFVSYYNRFSPLISEYYEWIIPLSLFIATTAIFSLYTACIFRSTFSSIINEVVNRALNILLIVIYFLGYINLDQFIFVFVAIQLLQALLILGYILYVDKISIKPDWEFFKKFKIHQILTFGLLMMFTAFASMGVKLIDQAIMGMMLPLSLVGVYSVGVFVTAVMEAPINSLERIATAKVAEAWATDNKKDLNRIYQESSKYLYLFGGLLFVGLNVCISYLFEFLPTEYQPAIPVAQIMSLASLVNLATGVNSSILAYSKKYIYQSALLIILIGLTIINNIWLIPIYGIIGAAIAMFISLSTFNILKFLIIWHRFGMQPFDSSTLKITLTIALSFIPYLLLPVFNSALINLLVAGSATAICYLTLTYLFKIVPEFHQYIPFLPKK